MGIHYIYIYINILAPKSTPLQGVMSSAGPSGEVMHSITMVAGKTQSLLMRLQQSCAWPAL
jgi:hypothetical protein